MFDHLGPMPKISFRKKPINYQAYFTFLLMAIIVFTLSWSIQSGSNIAAAPVDQPQVLVSTEALDQNIVLGSTNLSIFSMQIETKLAGVALKSLNIQAQGIYKAEFLEDLKLSHNGMQLGQLSDIDDQGILHFDLDGYVLPLGKNELRLTVKNSDNLEVGDILNFNLTDASSLVWSYEGKEYLARGAWPISGGTINIIPQGSLWAYQGLNKKELAVVAKQNNNLAEFSLAVDGERVDLDKLTFRYKTSNNEDIASDFILLSQGLVLAKAQAQDDLIEFNLNKPLSLAINQALPFVLAAKLGLGDYELELESVQGHGLVSGKIINLSEKLTLAKVISKEQLLQFSNLAIDKNINQDWLTAANISVKKLNSEAAVLHRLTWRLDSNLVDIKAAKILVNDKVKNLDLVIKEDKLIAKAAWSDPIVLSEFNTNIKLLLQIDKFQEGSFIQTSLLSDGQAYQADQWSDNLLWSVNGQKYNAYALPSLPLEPQLISN